MGGCARPSTLRPGHLPTSSGSYAPRVRVSKIKKRKILLIITKLETPRVRVEKRDKQNILVFNTSKKKKKSDGKRSIKIS